jgi:hypothetical protein
VWLGSSIPEARARTDPNGKFVLGSMPPGALFHLYLPRNRRTMEGQAELIQIPDGPANVDVGILRLRSADE